MKSSTEISDKNPRNEWSLFKAMKLRSVFNFKKVSSTTESKRVVTPRQPEVYFTEDVIYGIVKGISEKEIFQFIYNKAMEELATKEFYYGYLYKSGVLKYFALKSSTYLDNKISVFTLPLLIPGRYSYSFKKKNDKRIFIIDTEDDKFSVILTSLGTTEANDSDLKPIVLPEKIKIPQTLKLRWSYRKTAAFAFGLCAALLLASFCFAGVAFWDLQAIQQRIVFVPPKEQPVTETKGQQILNILNSLQKVAGNLKNGEGIIDKVTVNEGKMTFLVRFQNESDAQLFLKNVGGKYESGRVIYEISI